MLKSNILLLSCFKAYFARNEKALIIKNLKSKNLKNKYVS